MSAVAHGVEHGELLEPDQPLHAEVTTSERAAFVPEIFKQPIERVKKALNVEGGYKKHTLSMALEEVPPRRKSFIRRHLTKARLADEKVLIDEAWWYAVKTARAKALPLLLKEVEVAVAWAVARGFKPPPNLDTRTGASPHTTKG